MAKVEFRIAHLSDLHLAKQPDLIGFIDSQGPRGILTAASNVLRLRDKAAAVGTYSLDALWRLSKTLRRRDVASPYDAFVISGDLATTGAMADLDAAVNFLGGRLTYSSRYVIARDLPVGFNFASRPLIVVPGNHDRYRPVACSPGSMNFEKKFGTHWGSRISSQTNPPHARVRVYELSKKDSKVVFIAADLSYGASDSFNPIWYLGKGKAHYETLQRLKSATSVWSDKAAVLWVVHFPVSRTSRTDASVKKLVPWQLRLEYEHALVDAAVDLKVPLILSGHVHETDCDGALPWNPSNATEAETTRVVCASSASAAGCSSHSFVELVLQVEENRLAEVTPERVVY